MIIGGIVSSQLKSKVKKYSQITTVSGLSGKEIAERMLADNGISDVKVVSVPGKLTDHYNPTDKTIKNPSLRSCEMFNHVFSCKKCLKHR